MHLWFQLPSTSQPPSLHWSPRCSVPPTLGKAGLSPGEIVLYVGLSPELLEVWSPAFCSVLSDLYLGRNALYILLGMALVDYFSWGFLSAKVETEDKPKELYVWGMTGIPTRGLPISAKLPKTFFPTDCSWASKVGEQTGSGTLYPRDERLTGMS